MSENQHTTQIYTLIKDQEYSEAIELLNFQLESNPRSRAALQLPYRKKRSCRGL